MQPVGLKAFERKLMGDPIFQVAASLLTDWQSLLTYLTDNDVVCWTNLDTNIFVCKFGGISFCVQEWPEERIVFIGNTAIRSYDRADYGSDELLHAIWEQKKRKKNAK